MADSFSTYTGRLLKLSRRLIDESDNARFHIESDSFLFEIVITIMDHNTRNGQGPLTQLKTHFPPISITQTQATTPGGIADFLANAFNGMVLPLGYNELGRIGAFLEEFTRTTSPGTPYMAVAEVVLFDNEEMLRMAEDPSGRGMEVYLSELRAYLGDRERNCTGLELLKYEKQGGGLLGDGTCSVCLDEFEDEADVVRTVCSHYFHFKCIAVWMIRHASCPMCRSNMNPRAASGAAAP